MSNEERDREQGGSGHRDRGKEELRFHRLAVLQDDDQNKNEEGKDGEEFDLVQHGSMSGRVLIEC